MSRYIKYRKNTVYTPEVEQFFADNKHLSWRGLQVGLKELFGLELSKSAIMHKKQRLGLCTPRETKHRHIYTQEECEWIKEHCPGTHYEELTIQFNEHFNLSVTQSSIEHRCHRLGVNNGINCLFAKNKVIWNETPVGTIRINKYHSGKKSQLIKWIKVRTGKSRRNWEMLHYHVWKEHNGEVPKGKIVTFKDGDSMNCDISNLMLASRSEVCWLNKHKLKTDDPELNELYILTKRLENSIKEKRKNGKRNNKPTT